MPAQFRPKPKFIASLFSSPRRSRMTRALRMLVALRIACRIEVVQQTIVTGTRDT
jgi:hypothetical protein